METIHNDLLLSQLTDACNKIKLSGRIPVPDDNDVLQPFFEVLEMLLQKGLKKGLGVIGLKDYTFWNWIEGLRNSTKLESWISSKIDNIIFKVEKNHKLRRSIGRGRQFVRFAFQLKEFSSTLLCFINNPRYVRHWYQEPSIFFCQDQVDTLMKMVDVVESLGVDLNLMAVGFLDESWEIPVVQHLELVPCRQLGVSISTLQGRSVITGVRQNSVAAENNFEVGDCIEEYAGQFLTEKYNGRVGQLHMANQGLPIKCTLVKARRADGKAFGPLQTRYPQIITPLENGNRPLTNGNSMEAGYRIQLLGSYGTGKAGGLSIIQSSIQKVLEDRTKETEEVKMMLVERDVIVISIAEKKVKARYSFTSISACGLCQTDPVCFGLIAGNTSCSVADTFTCHVFKAPSNKIAHTLVNGIGKGFDRTLCCV